MKRVIIAIIVILIVFWGYSWFQGGRNEEKFALPERFDKVGNPPGGKEELIDDVDSKSNESDRANEEDDGETLDSLARELKVATSSIEILNIEEREWPNGCLGLEEPDEFCTQAIVPGFLIEISLGGEIYFYRTNADLSLIREQG